jgi:hypothetical protein
MIQIEVTPFVLLHKISLFSAVEVASPGDLPRCRYYSKIASRQRCGAVHQPDRSIAVGDVPENIALAVSVEIPGLSDRLRGRDQPEVDGRQYLRSVRQPTRYRRWCCATGYSPCRRR